MGGLLFVLIAGKKKKYAKNKEEFGEKRRNDVHGNRLYINDLYTSVGAKTYASV